METLGTATSSRTCGDRSNGPGHADRAAAQRVPLTTRIGAAATAAVGAVSGAAPHVLHHVGPIAGVALIGGAASTVVFGAIGLIASLPFLLRLRRRSGSWRTPVAALLIFAALFTISNTVIGPAIRGDSDDPPAAVTGSPAHDSHHQ